MPNSDECPSVLVGFGKNYYHNFGPAQQWKINHMAENDDGGIDSSSPSPSAVAPLASVSSYQFSLARKEDEKEDTKPSPPPPWEQEKDPLVDVQCTIASTYFLTQSGKIYNCGTVHGHVRPSLTQTIIQLPLKCVQIATGRHYCLARMEGGLAVCAWGAGHFGQLGLGGAYDGNGGDGNRAVSSSPPSFVERPTVVEGLLPHVVGAPVSSVAAGYWHSMAVTKDGNVFAWGCNRNAQCGKKPSSKDPPTVCQPQRVSFDETMKPDPSSPTSEARKAKKIKKIAAGRSHSVALDEAGQCHAWGANQYGQCGILTRRRVVGVASPKHVDALAKVRIVDISAGDMHTLALTGGGRVFGWGGGFEGQLGTGFIYQMNPKPKLVSDLDFVAIEAGLEWKSLQKEKLSAQGIGASSRSLSLDNTPRITSVTAKGNSSFAVSSTGHVYAWGCNDVGHLGLPKPDSKNLTYSDPGQVSAKTSIQRQFHTYSFDSSHNVALPQRLDSLRHLHVKSVGASSTFMWCLGTKRKDTKCPIGRTLYEVQEAKRKKSPRSQAQHEKLLETVHSGGFGTSIPSPSSLGESNSKGGKDQNQAKEELNSSKADSSFETPATGWTRPAALAPKDQTKTNAKDSIRVDTEQNDSTTKAVEDIPPSSSMEKKKRLFSPKKIVKALVRRGSSRSDRTSLRTADADSVQKSSPKNK
mmetsp:Transcript_13846/g.32345  ORF Transcript_13846/g.32345 Transcript_13846/m.32345 type:complete len:694 (+) Transcript_13846:103-2184(+)